MGTQLQQAGLEPAAAATCGTSISPKSCARIQRRYVAAGAQVLLTNTFGGTRIALDRHGAGARVRQLNRAALPRAARSTRRRAAGAGLWVLGDIGPFGGFVEPLGEHGQMTCSARSRSRQKPCWTGVWTACIIETMTAIDEVVLAYTAARDGHGCTVRHRVHRLRRHARRAPHHDGRHARAGAAAHACDLGVDALGANCGAVARTRTLRR
jgi:5-methyltetrahydrofolate--homocysteine methyltransferase